MGHDRATAANHERRYRRTVRKDIRRKRNQYPGSPPRRDIIGKQGGRHPWRNTYFTHSGGVTTEYFTDVDGGSVYVSIDNVEEHKDAGETMMKSLEFADDIAEAKTEAMDVKLDDIEINR